jgi:hypothetical protein
MSAYAASGRIGRVMPRLAPAELRLDAEPPRPTDPDSAATVVLTQPDDVLPGPTPTLAERWASARERWSQLTFYLLDPESWR